MSADHTHDQLLELLAHILAWNAFVEERTLKSIKNNRWTLPMARIK